MACKEFGSKWRSWAHGCLHSSHFSILINGSPKHFVRLSWSTTGGPLIPVLFTIVADAFDQILLKGVQQNLFRGFQVGKQLTPLAFTICGRHIDFPGWDFLDGEGSQLTNLISLIHYFKLVSGMRINCQKSCFVGLNTPPHNLLGIAEALKCPIRSFPVDYLGIPLGGNPAKKEFWSPVIERYQKKLATWKAKFLSFGGRITLIKEALSNLPVPFHF